MRDLVYQINENKNLFRTDGYPMSIGEIANMYKENEILINPDFQRFFRWSYSQKTKFIESILLGIPIPSIFVYQNDDGIWELVDGLQRVSTILEFMGILIDSNGQTLEPLILSKTKMLPALQGMTWEKFPREPLKLDFKRSKLNVEIIKKESDDNAKYEVFQRLNSGGSLLSDQEFRNCILLMINKNFYLWLDNLSKDENFQSCISLSDKLLKEKYDMELLCRYLVFPSFDFTQSEISEYVTDSLNDIIKIDLEGKYDRDKYEKIFKKTFMILNHSLEDQVFKKYDKDRNSFRGKFLVSLFEVISIGLSENIDKYSDNSENHALIINKIKNLWNEDGFTDYMGSGTNSKVRIPNIIPFGKTYFSNE